MKKQAFYLPNLSSIYMQNKRYLQHKEKLEQTKSQYNIHHTNRSHNVSKSDRKIHLLSKIQTEIPITHAEYQKETQLDQKQKQKGNHRPNSLSPFEKRKLSERQQENTRMILKLSSSVKPISASVDHIPHLAIRERLSKYIKDCNNKILYKYKKSLASIEQRKKQYDTRVSSRSMDLQQQAVTHLTTMMNHALKLAPFKIKKTPYQDIHCLCLKDCQDSAQYTELHITNPQKAIDRQKSLKSEPNLYPSKLERIADRLKGQQPHSSASSSYLSHEIFQNKIANRLGQKYKSKIGYLVNSKNSREESRIKSIRNNLSKLLERQKETQGIRLRIRKQKDIQDQIQIITLEPISKS